jgi:hypothetical protein
MTLRTRVSSASHDTRIAVEAEFEALAVYLVCNGLDSLWPLGRVRDQMPGAVSSLSRPAVIDVEILVSSIFQSQ